MRHPHSAQHDEPALAKGVNVETLPNPDLHLHPHPNGVGLY